MNDKKLNTLENLEQPDNKSLSVVEARVSKPYNSCNGIEIFNGDCREIMPSLPPVHWIITDPPFNADYGFENDNMSKEQFYLFTKDWMSKAEDLATEGFIIIVDPKYQEPFMRIGVDKFSYHHSYTWYKKNAMRGMQGGFANKTEVIVWTERKPEKVEQFPNDLWEIPLIPRDVNHPTPKPIKLLELILRKFTYEYETILDPFAGSGSTLRAAKELGRKATGIEINKDYCKVIIDEISQTEMQFRTNEAV